MSGTKKGGQLAAQKNKAKHGPDFYARIGSKGGKAGNTGGYASDVVGKDGMTGRQRAAYWGAIGGAVSRRGKKQ